MFDIKYANLLATIVLALYILIIISTKLPSLLQNLFNNNYFKIFMLIIIVLTATQSLIMAGLLAIAFFSTISILNTDNLNTNNLNTNNLNTDK